VHGVPSTKNIRHTQTKTTLQFFETTEHFCIKVQQCFPNTQIKACRIIVHKTDFAAVTGGCVYYTLSEDSDGFCRRRSVNSGPVIAFPRSTAFGQVGPFGVFFGTSSRDVFDNGRECERALVPLRLVSSHPLAGRVGPIHRGHIC